MGQETTKRKSKDSVFVKLFEDKRYVRRLYTELHPEDADISLDDIHVDTLHSFMLNTLYNDLGFVVKDRLVVLVEAQSQWCPNIPLRMLFYLSETYRRYLSETKQNEHSSRPVQLPQPELYVVYSGNREVPAEISFAKAFFGGNAPLDVQVKVLNRVDETICGEYIGYCHVYDEQRSIYHDSHECARRTVDICMQRGYLSEFLTDHQVEVITMMEELFDEEWQRQQYDLSEKEYNLKLGRAEGLAQGIKKGMAQGLEKGMAQGMAQGRTEGQMEKQAEIASNMLRLGLFSKENIALATGFPIEKINELAASLTSANANA